PSGLKASAVAPTIGRFVDRDVRRFQSTTGAFSGPIASAVPRESNARTADFPDSFFWARVRGSHKMTPAGVATATVRPSGLTAISVAATPTCSRATDRFDATSQTTAPTLVAAASNLPSALNARSSALEFNLATSE